ncbi:MAG: hypothetical protein A3G93_04250 [Nitrospinae bacterium RIFCSPLOWO2_12_FULL_45_22]|nr:MAG: hypothetical protein A3G93_04250 [Nitrospinae bacterium RIFCSPLOWO2_12_FULL_45_22]
MPSNSDLLKFAIRIDEVESILCGKDFEREVNKADIFDFLTLVSLTAKTNIGKLGSLKSKSITISFLDSYIPVDVCGSTPMKTASPEEVGLVLPKA